MSDEGIHPTSRDYPPTLVEVSNVLGTDTPEKCTIPGCPNPTSPVVQADYANPIGNPSYTHYMCAECARQYELGHMIQTSKPMDIAWRLLKNDDDNTLPENDPHYIYPNEQMWNDEADDDLKEKTNALWEYIESMHPQDKLMMLNQMNNPMLAMGINKDPRNRADMTDEETKKYINDAIWEMMFDAWQDSALEMPGGIDYDLEGNRKSGEPGDPVRAHAIHPSQWKKLASEPMDIAWRLLKTPVTPEAKRHKLEYDKKYQDNPKRVKYREELNRERRQRGVYGKGGKDMSHTKDGKIVPEDASKNRARHFKGRGTLKSFVLVKR